MKQSHTYTDDEIAEVFRDADAFTGDTCVSCKKTANVPSGRRWWTCTCNALNRGAGDYFHNRPYANPDIGPDTTRIARVAATVPIETRRARVARMG